MEIKKGDRFYCFRDVVMKNGMYKGKKAYKKGNPYVSEVDDCITDEHGNKTHVWEFYKHTEYFAKIGNYKGDIEGFPELVVEWMLIEQEAQGNERDVELFEEDKRRGKVRKGFTWIEAKYFNEFYCKEIICSRNFQVFFDKYPYGVAHNKPMPTIEEPECVEPKVEQSLYDLDNVIEAWNLNYRLGKAVEYINKGGNENLKKAMWYLNKEISK